MARLLKNETRDVLRDGEATAMVLETGGDELGFLAWLELLARIEPARGSAFVPTETELHGAPSRRARAVRGAAIARRAREL
jgi:hypothetical protein